MHCLTHLASPIDKLIQTCDVMPVSLYNMKRPAEGVNLAVAALGQVCAMTKPLGEINPSVAAS